MRLEVAFGQGFRLGVGSEEEVGRPKKSRIPLKATVPPLARAQETGVLPAAPLPVPGPDAGSRCALGHLPRAGGGGGVNKTQCPIASLEGFDPGPRGPLAGDFEGKGGRG